jgi:tRNA nucleotidyltransferase (CCA-adding enzyme)
VAALTHDLRERVRRLPGMESLLPALEGLPPVFLVGGAVRDLLRGTIAVDLDLAVEGDARPVARALAERLGGAAREHERFGTATVESPGLGFDLATTRRETYERPGALPSVEPAPLSEDLGRRDFTINALAVGLTGEDLGNLHDPSGGRADLEAGIVRVLHERSFLDDPTRLLRALRYEARLDYALDPDTERLAREAAAARAFDTISGDRIGDELIDLLAEEEAAAAVERLAALGLDRALNPALRADPELVASAELGAVAIGADRALSGLAALVSADPESLAPWLTELGLPAAPRDAALQAARSAPRLAAELREERSPSELRDLLVGEPSEALALTLALGAPSTPVMRWVGGLRDVRLEITGDDLLAAGVPEGPALGFALAQTLRRKLDGEIGGREEEFAAALAAAREAR